MAVERVKVSLVMMIVNYAAPQRSGEWLVGPGVRNLCKASVAAHLLTYAALTALMGVAYVGLRAICQ